MNIWYVDDDQEMLQAIRLLLKLLGHTMRPLLSGKHAAKLLHYGEAPDLFLFDINMPDLSGFDMVEYVRRDPAYNAIPIVMLSTEYNPSEITRAMQLGADAYATKPVTVEELEAALEEATSRRRPSGESTTHV
jgi:CheY-like chemotaxis protein